MKYILLFSLLAVGVLFGCQSVSEKHYPVQAEVISVRPQRGLIIVKHGEIPGLMPAMTMQYEVTDAKQIENLKPGDKITADLVVSEDKGRLEKITLVRHADDKAPENPN
jgi:protein SCO1